MTTGESTGLGITVCDGPICRARGATAAELRDASEHEIRTTPCVARCFYGPVVGVGDGDEVAVFYDLHGPRVAALTAWIADCGDEPARSDPSIRQRWRGVR